MNLNCENCVGETRIQCDAIYANTREYAGEMLESIVDIARNDTLVGELELQENAQKNSQKTLDALARLGCTLPGPERMQRAFLELSAGWDLKGAELEEQEEREEQARIERIEALVAESTSILAESRLLIADAQQAIENDAQTESERYCQENGWDIDNLAFYQQMDLKGHLRAEGFIK